MRRKEIDLDKLTDALLRIFELQDKDAKRKAQRKRAASRLHNIALHES